MAEYTPPPLSPPGPPNDTTPDSGLVGRGGIPEEIINNNPLLQEAFQAAEIDLVLAQNPYLTPIEGVLGGKAVAEKNQEYFAVVFEAGDTSPEIINQTQFKVTYLCDSVLNVSKPAEDTIAVNNITQNFERQKIAKVRVDQGTVLNQQLAGNHKITAVGSLEPILGTQIGKGPYEYVTTMSFQLKDQLDGTPGVRVAEYYIDAQKYGGYQDLPFSHATSGYITVPGVGGSPIGNWSYTNIIEASPSTPARVHYDGLNNVVTGSGSRLDQGFGGSINPSSGQISSLGFNTDNYFNKITLLTGSLEGNTRIKVKMGASVTIVTSSVNDLFVSTQVLDEPLYSLATLKVFKEETNGDITELGSEQKSIIATNQSLLGMNTINTLDNMSNFALGNLDQIGNIYQEINNGNFSWGPLVGNNIDSTNLLSSQDIVVETDYFDIEQDAVVYGELYVNNESTASSTFYFEDLSGGSLLNEKFTTSLETWKNDATVRKYKYKWGGLQIHQEVPNGINFINGVTGVTASYGYVGDNGFVTASSYNHTSSYWVGYNNIENESSSFSYITASSTLTNFYGGDYIQVNPGLESYNLFNANGSVPTPLFPNNNPSNDKKTWNRFGFNPIRLPFIPLVGDFIRFEYSKSKVFQIIGINSLGGVLKLKLDGIIPISTILDNFVIYRIIEDGQYIILDVKKNDEAGVNQAFSGLITAQYVSENLGARSDELIFDLKQAGIIEEGAYLSRRGYTQ